MTNGITELTPSEATSSVADHEAYKTTGTSPGRRTSLPPAVRGVAHVPDSWAPEHHPELAGAFQVPYEVVGASDAPVIVALGGISADCHVTAHALDARPGWWRELVGPGLAIDTDRWRVVGLDYLGSPGSWKEPDAACRELSLTARDQARAAAAVLDDLEVSAARAAVGASYGGTVALALGASASVCCDRVVTLAGPHRAHSFAVALRSVQQRIVAAGLERAEGAAALALARELAHTTYGCPRRYDRRFHFLPSWEEEGPVFPVNRYLADRGKDFAARFDPWAFLHLSRSIDVSFVPPGAVRVPVHIVGFAEDGLVPPWLLEELASGLSEPSSLTILSSAHGHDGFLKRSFPLETALWKALVLASEEVAR